MFHLVSPLCADRNSESFCLGGFVACFVLVVLGVLFGLSSSLSQLAEFPPLE